MFMRVDKLQAERLAPKHSKKARKDTTQKVR